MVNSVNRLKAAPPHFDQYVEAPAPNIIMRRKTTSERTLTLAAMGISSESKTRQGDRYGVMNKMRRTVNALRHASTAAPQYGPTPLRRSLSAVCTKDLTRLRN